MRGSLLRPCVPGLAALALMVFLWGLGYKLSLYHHRTSVPTRPVMAKLWMGPRGVTLLQPVVQSASGPAAVATAPQLFPPAAARAAKHRALVPSVIGTRRALLPSRSPPRFAAV